jgi:hypothetical protein
MLRRIVFALVSAVAALVLFGTAASADSCLNEQLRAESDSSALPDCRAFELVSPADKGGVNIGNSNTELPVFQASADGDATTFFTAGAIGDAPAARQQSAYRATRGASGWVTSSLDPPKAATHGIDSSPGQLLISSDLGQSLVQTGAALAPGAIAGDVNVYVRDADHLTYQLVGSAEAPPGFGLLPSPVGASDDFKHLVFQTRLPMTSNAVAGANNIYESSEGVLRLVDILPDGSVDPGGATAPADTPEETVSADGRRIIFGESWNGVPGVFMRVDGTSTIEISASQRSTPDPSGPQPAIFGSATRDGLQVFFTSTEKLTDDSAAISGGAPSADLYRYDVTSGVLTDLTVIPGGGEVSGVLGTHGNDPYTYFNSHAALAPGAAAGESNLYVLHDGQTSFIGASGDFAFTRRVGTYAISPSGRYIEFASANRLTAYDSHGTEEVYVYDADAKTLRCASCSPSGMPPTGPAALSGFNLGGNTNSFASPMLDNGLAFFQTPDALVPADTNGVQDVYEWNGGQVLLMSGGTGATPSELEDVSPTGSDVFFLTANQLVPQDVDALEDLYDARIGGGFASPGPSERALCIGEDCQGVILAPPVLLQPGSATFAGAGNTSGTAANPPKEAAKVTVVRKQKINRNAVTLTVRVPSGGSITVSGRLVRPARRTSTKPGTYKVRVTLTAKARKEVAKGRRLEMKARVKFVPTSGGSSTATVTLAFSAPASKSGR